MNLRIERESDRRMDFEEEAVARLVCEAVIEHMGCPYECQVELLLVDNEAIHEINREQRGIDRPTDVLSFPMLFPEEIQNWELLEDAGGCYFDPESGELLLGEIVLSLDKVVEQAEQYGHSLKREYAFLIAHSMLHLFGMDHETEAEAAQMEAKQKEILEGLKISRS